MFLSIESRVHRCRSRNQNLDSYSEHSDFRWSLRSFSVVLSLVKNLSEDVSVSGLYQQMWKIRSSQRISLDLSGLWESRMSSMSGIEERYSNNVCTSARFTFWSYFFFRSIRVPLNRFCSKKASGKNWFPDSQENITKAFKDKTERQNYEPSTCSCRLATAFNTLIWQLMPV